MGEFLSLINMLIDAIENEIEKLFIKVLKLNRLYPQLDSNLKNDILCSFNNSIAQIKNDLIRCVYLANKYRYRENSNLETYNNIIDVINCLESELMDVRDTIASNYIDKNNGMEEHGINHK